ncbi:hypothetical protein NM208_g6089 [Fusarium decemcellulare]|uniref:Uncharacterized protein n=1 Tax=Fusarium decemcellulare TaxID=57161 RepID=A0ACC1SEJ6_9HYPO|nr:hypothetical protein NM208_g6089 [Fusarium decemcellulare]
MIAFEDVVEFVVQTVKGAYSMIVRIGEAIYHAVLDSVAVVTRAIEWVFTKLGVGFEALRSFLGFAFNRGDILRSHKVIKNVTTKYALHSVSRIGSIRDVVSSELDFLESHLDAWAGIAADDTKDTKSIGFTANETNERTPALRDPQTHWLSEKLKTGIDRIEGIWKKDSTESEENEKSWRLVLDRLETFAGAETDTVKEVIAKVKREVIDNIYTLTPVNLIKKLLAIIGGLVLSTAKHIVVASLDIIQDLTTAVIKALDGPIKIPIISSLYKRISGGSELSIMDLICLVAAVPSTLLYKVVTGGTPFPENNYSVTKVTEATDFVTIQHILAADSALLKNFTIVSQFSGEPAKVPSTLRQVCIPIKLLVLLPGLMLRPRAALLSKASWEEQLDAAVADLALLKVCADCTWIGDKDIYGKASPYVDYAISALWMVPAIGKIVANHSAVEGSNGKDTRTIKYTAIAISLAYDVAVMTAPVVWEPALDPESKVIVLAGTNGVIMVAAGVRAAMAGFIHGDD